MGTCNYITQSDFDLYITEEVGNETYEELEELPQTLDYLQMFYKEAVKALENKDIDYIALCCNL